MKLYPHKVVVAWVLLLNFQVKLLEQEVMLCKGL